MTDTEKQRINVAIAEACGWQHRKYHTDSPQALWCNPDGVPIGFLPDYTDSLDAMHEAEKVLTDPQYSRYVTFIEMALVQNIREGTPYRERWALSAKSQQRAEAFCRALNLLPESPVVPPAPPENEER